MVSIMADPYTLGFYLTTAEGADRYLDAISRCYLGNFGRRIKKFFF